MASAGRSGFWNGYSVTRLARIAFKGMGTATWDKVHASRLASRPSGRASDRYGVHRPLGLETCYTTGSKISLREVVMVGFFWMQFLL